MKPQPTIRQIKGLLTVAKLGSFSRAAVELGISQSALSQSIQQMEFLLDVQLLERRHRAVAMTPAGETLVVRLERIMRDLDDAIDAAQSEAMSDVGEVRVACLSTVATMLLPAAVRRFLADYPNVRIATRDENVAGILNQVKSGEVDFAITCLFQDDRDVEFVPVIRDRFRFVCHETHPFASRRSVAWRDLETLSLVTVGKATGVRRIIDRAMPDGSPLDRANYEVSRVPSVLEILEQGAMSSVLPALTLAALRPRSGLTHLPLREPTVEREVGLLYARDRALTTLAAKFRDTFLATLRHEARRAPMLDVDILIDRTSDAETG